MTIAQHGYASGKNQVGGVGLLKIGDYVVKASMYAPTYIYKKMNWLQKLLRLEPEIGGNYLYREEGEKIIVCSPETYSKIAGLFTETKTGVGRKSKKEDGVEE